MSCPALQMESRPKYYGREWVSLYYSHLSFMYNCLLLNIGVYGKAHCSRHAVKEMQFVKHGQIFTIKCLMLLWRATVLGCVTDARIFSCCLKTKHNKVTNWNNIHTYLQLTPVRCCWCLCQLSSSPTSLSCLPLGHGLCHACFKSTLYRMPFFFKLAFAGVRDCMVLVSKCLHRRTAALRW